MLLPGVADCCWMAHIFALTTSSVLLTSRTFCFDLPAFASFKRQTNGNIPAGFATILVPVPDSPHREALSLSKRTPTVALLFRLVIRPGVGADL
jgi:hypothetical protein